MAKKKQVTVTDDNGPGKAYAAAVRERAQLLRSELLVSRMVRDRIAYDLDELARLAEIHPDIFKR